MESHSQVEDEAAEWLARQDTGHWSHEDDVAFERWIDVSTARRIAYLRLKSTWDTAGRLRALRGSATAGISAGGVPTPGKWRRSPFFEHSATQAPGALQRIQARAEEPELRRRRRNILLATAASIVVAMVVAVAAYHFGGGVGNRYATAVGGFASVPMMDGSKVTLNTDSVIRVALTEKERRVELEQGEAFFEVARDPSRPFVVRAGNKRITAVGTKFSVQHLGKHVRVLVTEGKVRVDEDESSAVLVTAGNLARADDSAVVVHKANPPQVEELTSWREGYVRFHETALADAVAEINRYNTRKIVIEDPQLAAVRISGTFRPTQYEAFVRVLQDGFSIQARNDGDRVTLNVSSRRDPVGQPGP